MRLPRPKPGAQAAGQAATQAMERASPAPVIGEGALANDDDDDGVEVEAETDEEEVGASGGGGGGAGGGARGDEATPAHKKRKVTGSGFPPRAPPPARR